MKVSQMQSMLARNAVVITRLCVTTTGCRERMKQSKDAVPNCLKFIRHARPQIIKLAAIQRSLKDDIKAARTSVRVYKKHGKGDARKQLYTHPMVARTAEPVYEFGYPVG